MVASPTDWKARLSPLNVLGPDGEPLIIHVLFGSDDQYGVDLANDLDEGEVLNAGEITNTLLRMASYSESADTDVTATSLIGGPQVSGTVMVQRIAGLERGRVYILEMLHGPAGNKRGPRAFVVCVE